MADDRIIKVTVKTSEPQKVSVQKTSDTHKVGVQPDLSNYWSKLARDWAIKMDGKVEDIDFSSKYYATESKNTVAGFDEHVLIKENEFDNYVQVKQDDFDAHAMEKEIEFDDNASIKQNLIDESAKKAKISEENAKASEIVAKKSEEECKRLVESLGTIFSYKGTVATYNDLPTINRNGDVYRVLDQGVFYVWVDNSWESLGGLIDISTLVTINTDQEISGHKTFTSDQAINSPDLDIRTDRSKRGNGLIFTDKNGTQTAGIGVYINNNQSPECRFIASNGTKSAFAGLGVTTDGQGFFEIPRPSDSSNNNDAVPSSWVNDKLDQEQLKYRQLTGLLTGNVTTYKDGYNDVVKMNSSVVEHKYDVIKSEIETDNEGWHIGYIDSGVQLNISKQWKLSLGFVIDGYPHEQGLFNFKNEMEGDPNSCIIVDKNGKIKCRFTTTNKQHLEEIDYVINIGYEYRVTFEYDKFLGYTINIYDGANIVKTLVINDTAPIDGDTLRMVEYGIGYNSGTKLEGKLKGDFIQAISEDKLVYAPHLAIHYRLSTYGVKIADVEYRDVVTAMYNLKGYAPYYTIDTINENYTLPMGNVYRYDNQKANANEVLNKGMITNCITEIPQDIKLELKDGNLYIKAGSKVYRPNNTFSILSSDKGKLTPNLTGDLMYYVNEDNTLDTILISSTYSGDTFPGNNSLWFDTVNLNIKRTSTSGVQKDNCSFPIAICKSESGKLTEIKQIFNGFGYIGSTVFALPNVKGLIPNGRNADGSLINKEFATRTVLTQTYSTTYSGFNIRLNDNSIFISSPQNYFYNSNSNFNMEVNGNIDAVLVGNMSATSGRINLLEQPQPLRVASYYDIDGKWFRKAERVIDFTKVGNYTVDLTPFLPQENGLYEIILYMRISRSDTSGTNSVVRIYTNFGDPNAYWGAFECDGANWQQNNAIVTVLTDDKKFKINLDKYALQSGYFYLQAYRRVK